MNRLMCFECSSRERPLRAESSALTWCTHCSMYTGRVTAVLRTAVVDLSVSSVPMRQLSHTAVDLGSRSIHSTCTGSSSTKFSTVDLLRLLE